MDFELLKQVVGALLLCAVTIGGVTLMVIGLRGLLGWSGADNCDD